MEKKKYIGKVFGHFRILEQLGQGGMGLVFKALNTHLDKIVAIKMIAPGLSFNEKLLNRFKTEARALARLQNPHIVSISDLLEANGQWFIVMEYVEGDTLRDRLREKRPLPLPQALEFTRQILSALQHAHSARIIHRDIKPSNILIDKDGTVKVTDFGLAKIQENSLINTQLSAVGGTLYYMSPEQVRSLKETDHRTDIYSLGITVYQMVTGTVPFDPAQTDFDIRETIVRKPFPKPSTFNPYLPPEVDDFVLKAIAKNPDDRFQSAVEMMQALEQLQKQLGDRLNTIPESSGDTSEEINFSEYPFEIKNDFSEEGEIPPIPVEQTPPPEPPEPPSEVAEDSQPPADDLSGITHITEMVKNKRFWLVSLIPVALILILFVFSLNRQKPAALPQQPKAAYLSVVSQPSNATVFIDGRLVGKTPLDSLQIRKHRFHLEISAANRARFDTVLQVPAGSHLLFSALLQPKVEQEVKKPKRTTKPIKQNNLNLQTLSLTSTPSGAQVYINGRLVGQTPLKSQFRKNQKLTIRLEKEGYQSVQKQIQISASAANDHFFTLLPLKAKVTLTSNVFPLKVKIDDKKELTIQNAKQSLTLGAGKHLLHFSHVNYQPQQKTVFLKPGQNLQIQVKLQPQMGTLEVHVLPWGNIYIDGKLQKRETNIKERFRLPAGRHLVKIANPAFPQIEQEVTVTSNQTTSYTYNLNQKGEVRVLAFDGQNNARFVEIFVDGKSSGQYTPGSIFLPPGKHAISVGARNAVEKSVMVLPGQTQTVKFVLK